jgi:hypothetical protein
MSIWALCEGDNYCNRIDVEPWRVVEFQHILSSRDLVDSSKEHDLLEELLESSKPRIADTTHYLIFTPFRYPPLKYGSRFGQVFEGSLWYGSLELKTAFYEVAYYRLKFFDDSDANLGNVEIPMTAFKTHIKTEKGVDLTKAPFREHQIKISSPASYEYSQPLGTEMRQSGVEAFLFMSARIQDFGKNVAAFTPEVFIKNNEQYITNMQSWECWADNRSIEFTRIDYRGKKEKYVCLKEYF